MSPSVNPSRPYDASGRRAQARRTRAAVLATATELFLRDGYAATTVGAIAEAAGVSVETIYKNFKNKPGLVKACFDVAVVGDDEPVAMLDRDDGIVARVLAEPDPRQKLVIYGAHIADAMERTGRIQLLVHAAAATDEGAAGVWTEMGDEKIIGMTNLAGHLKACKALRKGVTAEEARDVLWTFLSAELWDLLVNQRGWSSSRYGKWVGQQLIAALV